MPDNVVHLAVATNDAKYSDAETTLLQVLQRVRSGEVRADQLLIISVDRSDVTAFNPQIFNSGLRMSEMLALIEVSKAKIFTAMGF